MHPLYRAVYAVGHTAVGVDGRRWAAVLALGDGAFLSHHSAADAHGLRKSGSSVVHITVRGRTGRKRRDGIRIHRPRKLADDEVTSVRGLPISTPARTLLDLAASGMRGRGLEAALDSAELLRLVDFAELHDLVARHRGRPGAGALEAQLSRYGGPVDTRSRLERLAFELCADHGLPRPLVNVVIEGKVRDLSWPHRRLVVEADSYRWHRSPSALDDDRERDVELTLAGYRVLRFTYQQVTRRRKYVARAIETALGAT